MCVLPNSDPRRLPGDDVTLPPYRCDETIPDTWASDTCGTVVIAAHNVVFGTDTVCDVDG